MQPTIAALYIDPKGPYPAIAGVDCWDATRDARKYDGPYPVVAHPPCGPWGKLRHLSRNDDPSLALRAVEQVRRWGGVLEHPAPIHFSFVNAGCHIRANCRTRSTAARSKSVNVIGDTSRVNARGFISSARERSHAFRRIVSRRTGLPEGAPNAGASRQALRFVPRSNGAARPRHLPIGSCA